MEAPIELVEPAGHAINLFLGFPSSISYAACAADTAELVDVAFVTDSLKSGEIFAQIRRASAVYSSSDRCPCWSELKS